MTEIEDRSGGALVELERGPRGAAPIYDETGAIGRLMHTTFVTAHLLDGGDRLPKQSLGVHAPTAKPPEKIHSFRHELCVMP